MSGRLRDDDRIAAFYLRDFLSLSAGAANLRALQWRSAMAAEGLSHATINRRLAAIRSLVKVARMTGLVVWTIEVANLEYRAYRDTRGPGEPGVRRMLEVLDGDPSPLAVRDRAIVRLLFERALRRGEVSSLDLEHVDLDGARISVLGKGRSDREWIGIARTTAAALAEWISVRGTGDGPLFTTLSGSRVGNRLSGHEIWRRIRRIGARATLSTTRPHGLRHAAASHALDVTHGDIRRVQRLGRWAGADVVLKYDDNRRDLGREVSELIAIDLDA